MIKHGASFRLVEEAGYTVTPTAQGRYIYRMWDLLNILESERDFVHQQYTVRLLSNAQLRKGTAYTLKELMQIARPGSIVERFFDDIKLMLDRRYFFRGYTLECWNCGYYAWYPVKALNTEMSSIECQGCHEDIQLPLELDFSYRLNHLCSQALNNGALSTLLALHQLTGNHSHPQAGTAFLVSKNNFQCEIDLLVNLGIGRRYIAECKDNFNETATLLEQLRKNVIVAKDISAAPVFATLAETIPDEVTTFCTENGIRVLSRAELVRS